MTSNNSVKRDYVLLIVSLGFLYSLIGGLIIIALYYINPIVGIIGLIYLGNNLLRTFIIELTKYQDIFGQKEMQKVHKKSSKDLTEEELFKLYGPK